VVRWLCGWEGKAPYVCALLLASAKSAFVEGGGAIGTIGGEHWCIHDYGSVRRGVVDQYFLNIVVGEQGEGVTNEVDKVNFGNDVLGGECRTLVCIVLQRESGKFCA